MRRRLLRTLSLTLGTALSLVGCGDESYAQDPVAAEYGIPYVEPLPSVRMQGRVTGGEQPLRGIQVEVDGVTALTDAEGSWSLELPLPGPECEVVARDVDGEAGGAWQEAKAPCDDALAEGLTMALTPQEPPQR